MNLVTRSQRDGVLRAALRGRDGYGETQTITRILSEEGRGKVEKRILDREKGFSKT